MSKKLSEGERVARVMDNLDLDFVEAAHYERDRSYRPDSIAQTPLGGKITNVEAYASTEVVMLAWPTLFCMAHGYDHECAFTHKVAVARGIGVCNLAWVNDRDSYRDSVRVPAVVSKSSSGAITR